MSLLIDTHTFLWWVADSPLLSNYSRQLLYQEEVEIYLSMVSVWEIAIKVSIGKLDINQPLPDFINRQLAENDIKLLNIQLKHVTKVVTLPHHHRDPFDRLLAAQVLTENLQLLSKDKIFDDYGVTRLW